MIDPGEGSATAAAARDPFDARFPRHAVGLLAEFARSGVLCAADVHVAGRLQELAGERDERVGLAVALAVRAPRLGHVHVDLRRIRETAAVEHDLPVDLGRLPWPEPERWIATVARSRLVAQTAAEEAAEGMAPPLRLEGSRLYLDRYWQLECALAADILMRSCPAPEVDERLLTTGIARVFAGKQDESQRQAAATALLRRFTVIAGGPGTGKTTTVARILALLYEQAGAEAEASARGASEQPSPSLAGAGAAPIGGRPPLVALSAPTGRAAARLEEAVHEEAQRLDIAPEVRARLLALRASTLHRLLGSRLDSRSRFYHNRYQRLPHDLVVVDESSMVSLALMARLLEAVRPSARVVLVGDPDQLASVEAGAVLGDIAGPAADAPPAAHPPAGATLAEGIITLERVYRFGAEIAGLAAAIRAGREDAAVALLRRHPSAGSATGPRGSAAANGPPAAGPPGSGGANGPPAARSSAGAELSVADRPSDRVTWIEVDSAEQGEPALEPLRQRVLAGTAAVIRAARDGDSLAAIEGLRAFRLLCAHRRGPYGVLRWTRLIESWLEPELEGAPIDGDWYPGRPLLVVENDYDLGLFNGDLGVVVADPDDGLTVVFERRGKVERFPRHRLGPLEPAHALTVHKSQGSQFDAVAVVLPDPSSPLLTRELLYTAVTRARREVVLIGAEASVRRAVGRPIARATGLRERLRGRPDGSSRQCDAGRAGPHCR